MNIYERVKCTASNQNLTIAELESKAGISNGSISKWDRSFPKVDSIYKVALVLKLPIEYFLTGDIESNTLELSDKEVSMLQQYRALGETDQEEIIRIIEIKLDLAFPEASSSTSRRGKKNTITTDETA